MSADIEGAAKNLVERLLAWWRAGSIERLDAAEIDRIAREFGLVAKDLLAINRNGACASQSLHRMIRAKGLAYEELRQTHADVLRDLEIHCSLCGERKRCRKELDLGAAEGFADYCPNAPTLVELQAEALQRLN